MKKLFVLTLLIAFNALAGELDKLKPSEIMAMPMEKLEKIYLKEKCPDVECDFGYGSHNSSNLSKAEMFAIWNYTIGEFESITPALYSGKLTGSQLGFVRLMDSGLKKIPNEKTKVFRGTIKNPPAKVGGVIELKAFTSTSVDEFVAEGFIHNRFLIINTKTGKDILDYSQAGMEREILLPRGTKIRVDKVINKKMMLGPDPYNLESRMVEVVHATEI